jgi:hypothetical protein
MPEYMVVRSEYVVGAFAGSTYVVDPRTDDEGYSADEDPAARLDALVDAATNQEHDRSDLADSPEQAQERTDLIEGLYKSQIEAIAEREVDE